MRIYRTILGASALFLSQANNYNFAQVNESQPQKRPSEAQLLEKKLAEINLTSEDNTEITGLTNAPEESYGERFKDLESDDPPTNRDIEAIQERGRKGQERATVEAWKEISKSSRNRRSIENPKKDFVLAGEEIKSEETKPKKSTTDEESNILFYTLLALGGGTSILIGKRIKDNRDLKKGILKLKGFSERVRLYPAELGLKDLRSIRKVIKQLEKYSPDFKDFFQNVSENRIIVFAPTGDFVSKGHRNYIAQSSDHTINPFLPENATETQELISIIFSINKWNITGPVQTTEIGPNGKVTLSGRTNLQLSPDEAILYRLCLEARKICSTRDGSKPVDRKANSVLVLHWMNSLKQCNDKDEKALLEKLISAAQHSIRILDGDKSPMSAN